MSAPSPTPNPLADMSIEIPFLSQQQQQQQQRQSPAIANRDNLSSPAAVPSLSLSDHSELGSPNSQGTSASTMEAIASTVLGSSNVYEPPTKIGRRRSNSVHGPLSSPSNNNESLQPVNFGAGQTVHFSPGSNSGNPANIGQRASRTQLSSSFTSGMPINVSSASLYSSTTELSDNSNSPGALSVSTGTASAGVVSKTGSIPMVRTSSTGNMDKRQKRLERNRESARASRKRRKYYLEELEVKVNKMSEDMDKGRMQHAASAVPTIRGMRLQLLYDVEQQLGSMSISADAAQSSSMAAASGGGIQHNVTSIPPQIPQQPSLEQRILPLTTNLSRTTDELQITQTFMRQQLLSLVQPTSDRFLLWLSLQKDGFFRGGRSASERLSAGRIGERLLHGGQTRATPSSGMWPLTCHEIGLSYDQEDRIRTTQRAILANPETWVHRHTALATKNVVESIHDVLGEAQVAAKRRERTLMDILTPEQRVKFMGWASRKGDVLRRLTENQAAAARASVSGEQSSDDEYKTSPNRHVAANLYIIDHILSGMKQRQRDQGKQQQQQQGVPLNSFVRVNPKKLKKLARRPTLESLAGIEGADSDTDGNAKLSREKSYPSTGSMKRNLTDMSDDNNMMKSESNSSLNSHVTPDSAQVAGHAAVIAALGDVMKILPENAQYKPPPPTSIAAQPMAATSSTQLIQPSKTQPAARKKYQPRTKKEPPKKQAATTDDIDIPMPTPVSVLMQTSDDFIFEPMYDQQEPLVAEQYDYGYQNQTSSSNSFLPNMPEPVNSSHGMLSNRYASAPELSSFGGTTSPPQDFSYPSILPTEPMSVIPERQTSISSGGVPYYERQSSNSSGINPMMMMPPPPTGATQGEEEMEFGGLDLEDLAMDPDEWMVGLSP